MSKLSELKKKYLSFSAIMKYLAAILLFFSGAFAGSEVETRRDKTQFITGPSLVIPLTAGEDGKPTPVQLPPFPDANEIFDIDKSDNVIE